MSGKLMETFVFQELAAQIDFYDDDYSLYQYRDNRNREIDFVVEDKNVVYAVECKLSAAPKLSRGNHLAIADIKPHHTYVVVPEGEAWTMSAGITATSLLSLKQSLHQDVW
jgi:predicted AAA+ superfamily ATPase